MRNSTPARLVQYAALITAFGLAPPTARAAEPIVHTLSFPEPETHIAQVRAVVPTSKAASIEIMMAVWSPGFYRVESYADQVENLEARTTDGAPLMVESTRKNRWRIQTAGEPKVVVSYQLACKRSSVTTNYVSGELGVMNGAATFLTLVEEVRRPHEVRIELAPEWKRSVTALEPAADGRPNHYHAPDFDTLVDSPIAAGDPDIHEFEVDGSTHCLVNLGDKGSFDGRKAAEEIQRIVRETRRYWGFLPFKKYYFLNVFRRGGGGLEHKNSTLLTANLARMANPKANFRWLSFVSHEYFHAFNVKRLRPIELGPFDYENPPITSSLWIAEGLTTYCGDLILIRAGLGSTEDYLSAMSSHIDQLQNSPGRLLQSLEQASQDVWKSGTSGVVRDGATKVSYYVKGPVVGWLLDARIRRGTEDKQSLDDAMRLAYRRYSGERGFTPEEFRKTAEEVAGADLKEWFRIAISSAEELDYTPALDWYGLRFAPPEEPEKTSEAAGEGSSKKDEPKKKEPEAKWKLQIRSDATVAQKRHLHSLLGPRT